jgi:hypothetical protein
MTSVILPASSMARISSPPDLTRWGFIDNAYCLTLSTRMDRQSEALGQISAAGLSAKTSFIISEPATGPKPPAIFESHCQAARHAIGCGYKTVLILEDDATFIPHPEPPDDRVERTIGKLPPDWQGLYLGHFPLRAYFISSGLLRTSSGCSHAYLANRPLLDWLASLNPATDLKAGRIKLNRLVGQGIDAALACRPHMYACFPMLVTQGRSPSSNINSRLDRAGNKRRILDKYRYSALAIRCMRLAEWFAAGLSPLHWATRAQWLAEEDR